MSFATYDLEEHYIYNEYSYDNIQSTNQLSLEENFVINYKEDPLPVKLEVYYPVSVEQVPVELETYEPLQVIPVTDVQVPIDPVPVVQVLIDPVPVVQVPIDPIHDIRQYIKSKTQSRK